MKLRIVIGILLVAAIAELVWLCFALEKDHIAAQNNAEQQEIQLWQKENQVSDLQEELEGLEDDIYGDLNTQITRLQEEIAMLSGQKEDIAKEIEALEQEMATLADTISQLKAENEYYLEVYNELEQGLEKVKGYIAGD